MKRVLKRFLSLTMALLLAVSLLPPLTYTAEAAEASEVTGLTNENIGLSYSGNKADAWSANGTTVTGSVVSVGGTCSATAYSSTLTITNKKTIAATLSFEYAVELNSGKITVDGSEVTAGGSYSKELAAGESVTVEIASGSTTATKIILTNVRMLSDVTATATFQPAENGTYTVDGKVISENYSNTQSSMTAYQLVAAPADGYQFLGWFDMTTGKCLSRAASTSLNVESECVITAKFAGKTAAIFVVSGQPFDDLNDASAYAQTNHQDKITLATDGSIRGSYVIPAGITLLIPFDESGTLYTDNPAAIRTTPASKAFRTLALAEGTSLTVNGAISLGGRYFAAGGGQQGRPVGDYGYIKMGDGSAITVKDGGSLYAWGFISGNGSVTAESGATVYEFYQIADFRGGSASSNMGNKVFPFSQYFVQNIEVPLTLHAGASEKVFSGVYAMSTTYTTTIDFIGDKGMFKVASGSFTKDYDEKTDRLVFTVNGDAELNTLALKLAAMSVNSANYVLPITNNISIHIQSGKVTINQDIALLAGTEVNIAEGAELTVADGKSVYVYDADQWNADNFVWGNCKFKSVAYAPGKAYNRTNNDLKDVRIDVNGTLRAIGALYTTEGGADIISSNGSGIYVQQGTVGTDTKTYQYNSSSEKAEIPITPARLHNADGSYTAGAQWKGAVVTCENGTWVVPQCPHADTELRGAKDPSLNEDGYTGDIYCKNCGEMLRKGSAIAKTGVTVTWKNENGDVLKTETVEKGTVPAYSGETPVKDETPRYSYTFKGWDKEPAAVTEDTTYTAVFTSVGKNGLCVEGEDTYWIADGENVAFPGLQRVETATGEVNYYYFGEDGKAVKNGTYKVEKNNGLPLPAFQYRFDENGVIEHDADTSKNGIAKADNSGSLYYFIDGVKVGMGLIRIGDDYYYARTSSGEIVCGRDYWVSQNNGLPIQPGMYHFGADGRLEVLNGFVEQSGATYYYENGVLIKGLARIGEDFYLFNTGSGRMYSDGTFWVGENSCGVAGGWYAFGADGRMIRTGFVTAGENTYYYQDGALVKGFTKIGGDYYFFNGGSGKMYRDTTLWVGENGYGITGGMYYFGADGKMAVPDLENGRKAVVSENGKLYFTMDGARMTNGLYELDGAYYYARSSGELAVNQSAYAATDLLSGTGWYAFGADGKLILTGFAAGGGYTYYYADGVRAKGLTKIGDDYYFFNRGSGKMYQDASVWVGVNDCGIETGLHYFDADGRMTNG